MADDWTPETLETFALDVKGILRSHRCKIEYTKVDGTHKTTIFTLQPDLLPPLVESDEKKPEKKTNPDVIVAYSLDDKAWRSFRIRNFISLDII